MNLAYQQGDTLWFKTDKIPKEAKAITGDLLWKGRNHHHRVKGKFSIRKHGEDIYLSAKDATLFHEEHKSIDLAPGIYKLGIVVEYDHLSEESRKVID